MTVKSLIIASTDRDLKACRENLMEAQDYRDMLLSKTSAAVSTQEEFQKKYDALKKKLAEIYRSFAH